MLNVLPNDERATQVIVACGDAYERAEICELLRRDHQFFVRQAAEWDELSAHMDAAPCDVVVLTAEFGDISGFEANHRLKTFLTDPPATVMVGVPGTPHAVIKAFRCGFADYVPHDQRHSADLHDAVLRAAEIATRQREISQRVKDLERLAQRDSTTGLVNRHYLSERLEQLTAIGRRHGVNFAAILIRVDHFEQIAGVFGCKVADAVLLAFARQLRSASRKSDTYGRLNRDTFLYLVDQQVTPATVAGACARLRNALSFTLDLDAATLSLSASISAATFPADGQSAAELLLTAERELGIETPFMSSVIVSTPLGETAHADTSVVPMAAPALDVVGTRMSDRRDSVRRRCLKRGMLVFSGGFSTVNCLVRDLSERGARIEVEGSIDMHNVFELRLIESGQHFHVEKRWQSGNKYGLRFVD